MTDIPSVRQQQIIDWLRDQPTLTIDYLVNQLGVSMMTVHRDLDSLASAGLVEKVHGGVTRAKSAAGISTGCAICSGMISSRTSFTIHTEADQHLDACCPHCGFLLLEQNSDTNRILVRDFLYGRVLNAAQAHFVIGSEIALCCMPSTLCFASHTDAERFQRGFGGQVMDFESTRQYLSHHA